MFQFNLRRAYFRSGSPQIDTSAKRLIVQIERIGLIFQRALGKFLLTGSARVTLSRFAFNELRLGTFTRSICILNFGRAAFSLARSLVRSRH